MLDAILALNAGSSSIKFGLFEVRDGSSLGVMSKGEIEGVGGDPHFTATDAAGSTLADEHWRGKDAGYDAMLGALLAWAEKHVQPDTLAAVGHRVVHGGRVFIAPVRLTAEIVQQLDALTPLAPLHQPHSLAPIRTLMALRPGMPQVACFDTAFHRTMPRVARLLPIPRRYEAEGLQRYGFHGLSYTYLAQELARVAGEPAARGRVVLAHLGAGASLAALRDGRCVDTTMGFTPNSGVPMGTRSGDLDPGVILYLLRAGGLGTDALDDVLSRRSGLLGVSETSADMRDLLEHRAGDPRAADAVALFCHSVRKAIGALTATIGGLQTLVFSGGIGENAAPIRGEIARGLEHLGIEVDDARNAADAAVISADASACTVRVIRTDEESIIARETLATIGGTT